MCLRVSRLADVFTRSQFDLLTENNLFKIENQNSVGVAMCKKAWKDFFVFRGREVRGVYKTQAYLRFVCIMLTNKFNQFSTWQVEN